MRGHARLWMGGTFSVLVLGGTLAAWWWLMPWAIRSQAREAGRRRGLELTVGEVDAEWNRIVLRDLRARAGGALQVQVDHIDLGTGVWPLLRDGRAAIRRVEARGVVVSLHLDRDRQQLRALLDRRGAAAGGGGSSARRVRLRGLHLRVRDRDGLLLRSDGGRLNIAPEQLTFGIGALQVAHDSLDVVRAQHAEAELRRSDAGAWQLRRALAREVEVVYREPREAARTGSVLARWRRHAELLAEPRGLFSGGRPDPPSRGGAEASAPDSAEAGPRDPESAEGALDRAVRALRSVRPRFAEGAVFALSELSVGIRAADDQIRPVLRDFEGQVRVLDDDLYELSGSGRPARAGRLAWSLHVRPEELRAEGSVDFENLPFALLLPLMPAIPWHQPEETRLTGSVRIEGRGAERVRLEGRVNVSDLALASARIAPRPVRAPSLAAQGVAEWVPLARRLEIAQGNLRIGAARAELRGAVAWPDDDYLVDLNAVLPPTDCNVAVGAIPADLLGELTGFRFTGRLGAQLRLRVDSQDLDATVLTLRMANRCGFVSAPPLADVARFEGAFRHRVVEPDESIFEMETGPGTRAWTPLHQISPFLVQAVLGHEDGGFARHSGFELSSIRTALIRNLRADRYVYGASTITMQLVKNVFLRREKTLARKVQEVLLTWWLESVWDKPRILELYLNVIEYGPDIYGIRNATRHYFGREPNELGPAEAAYLATILPNPKRFHEHWVDDALPTRHRRRLARFLRGLASRGRFDERALAYALERLEDFDFHQVDEGPPAPHVEPGGTRALPFDVGADEAATWDEVDGLPPEDDLPREVESEFIDDGRPDDF